MKLLKTISNRWQSPTPPFFKSLGNIGLVVASIGAAILSAPIAAPAIFTTVAGYLITAGSIATCISQITVDDNSTLES